MLSSTVVYFDKQEKIHLQNSDEHFCKRMCNIVGRVAQSVWRLATGWTVWGSNPGAGEIFRICPDQPWGPPSPLYNEYWAFTRGRKRLGCDADPSHLTVPRSKNRVVLYLYSLRAFVASKKRVKTICYITQTFFY
jgi:hypothetical protein